MACNSVVSVSYTLTGKLSISAIYVPLVAGTESGKPYYTWYDPNLDLNIKMYWNPIQGRWEMKFIIDDFVFAFLNLAELECPGNLGTNGWVMLDDGFADVMTILVEPVVPVDPSDTCCVNIQFSAEGEDSINVSCVKVLPLTSPAKYTIDLDSVYPGLVLLLTTINGFWTIVDESNPSNVYFTSFYSSNCPDSIFDGVWTKTDVVFMYDTFVIYRVPCEVGDNDIPADVDPPYCDVPCRNGNFLKKQKAILGKNIADISKREVFGLKCEDNWEHIFMKSLIIDGLSCLPYGVYSEDEEACLIGKLTDKCNC